MTKNRYLIALPVPSETSRTIREFFFKKTRQEIAIQDLHISLTYPFYLKDENTEGTLQELLSQHLSPPLLADIIGVGLYMETKNLHLNIHSPEIVRLQYDFSQALSSYVSLDLSPFPNGIPPYEPHISLQYQTEFTQQQIDEWNTEFSKINITLSRIEIKKEEEQWTTISTIHLH